MKRILLIAGTRPNFIKLAPLYHTLKQSGLFSIYICHTGQHFDFNMSDIFWQNLELPEPDFQLNIRGHNVVDTIGKTILGINEVIQSHSFDLIIVFGDVNATAAGAIVGAQSRIPVMHIEAGLRSFDREMPEEINRIITDHISDYLMVSEPSGLKNLTQEGLSGDNISMVGNIMIECLLRTRLLWEAGKLPEKIDAIKKPVVATFHRPENVDNQDNLGRVIDILLGVAADHPVIFPVHPRTKSKLENLGLFEQLIKNERILVTEPLSYFEFLKLISNASFIVTDSGGVQEETSYLNIPCITFRRNTERPITVELGTNMMLGIWESDYIEKIRDHVKTIKHRKITAIPLWDDEVSLRIAKFIKENVFR